MSYGCGSVANWQQIRNNPARLTECTRRVYFRFRFGIGRPERQAFMALILHSNAARRLNKTFRFAFVIGCYS